MQEGGHVDMFESARRIFYFSRKRGHVLQKEDVW